MLDYEAGQTLLFDKPQGWSSFDLVKKVRNLIKIKKVGHAGTLDPLATGLMILCTGRHTKLIDSLQAQEKEYELVMCLGATTASYDAEMPPENIVDASHITPEQVAEAMRSFVGEIEQVPPIYSALKVNGKRAYELARKGREVELKARNISIYELELTRFVSPSEIHARVRCSKGTYIRSLVHDIGQKLQTGAYMSGLRRTRIGDFRLADAWSLDDFVAANRPDLAEKA